MRGAGAVIHSHGIETCIATMLNLGAKEFRVIPIVQVSSI
jgi:methylthioribulose 1-phosphate dehydratase/enolase-phosphatase E1